MTGKERVSTKTEHTEEECTRSGLGEGGQGDIKSSVLDVVKLVCPWGLQIKMLSKGLETSQRNLRVHGDGSPRPGRDDYIQRAWQRTNLG